MSRRVGASLVAILLLTACLASIPGLAVSPASADPAYKLPWRAGETWRVSLLQGHHAGNGFHAWDISPVISGSSNADVVAVGSGTAKVQCSVPGATANVILTVNGHEFEYGHLQASSVPAQGTTWNVRQGELIGRLNPVSNFGDRCGSGSYSHLHFGFRSIPFSLEAQGGSVAFSTGSPVAGTFLTSNNSNGPGRGGTDTPVTVRHGSFENGNGFTRRVPTGATVNMVRYNNKPAHDGKVLLATNATKGGSILQDISTPIAAGESITVTAWVRSQSGTATGKLCAWGLGITANENTCESYSVNTTWKQLQVTLAPSGAHNNLRIELYPTSGGGTTFIDTVNATR